MTPSGTGYHQHTSYNRRKMGGHLLDWANQPDKYKEYPGLPSFPLPRELPQNDDSLFAIQAAKHSAAQTLNSFEQLCRIFATAYPITSKSRYPGGEFFHRSVPSAGGLYPCELYMLIQDPSESLFIKEGRELPNGLYHYSVAHHTLTRIRTGNFLEKDTVLTFFITAIFFRSAWKYRDRSYRYHLLDTGHLLENLTLSLKAAGLSFEAAYDFDDQKVNDFLGVDSQREVCLAIVNGGQIPWDMISAESLPEAVAKASRVSQVEMQYSALAEIHEKSVQIVKPSSPLPNMLSQTGISPQLETKLPDPDKLPDIMNFTETVMNRRSMRNFVSAELPKAHFDALLNFLCLPAEGDPEGIFQEGCVSMGFLAGNVEGLEPGCYWANRTESAISLSKSGFLMNEMTRICLDQEWLSQAALHFFFAANLEWLEENMGPRGYRYAMLIAGQLGQKIYLGATALGLGVCGIGAFYDDEASALLELNDSSAMLYLVAAGPVKRLFTGKTP